MKRARVGVVMQEEKAGEWVGFKRGFLTLRETIPGRTSRIVSERKKWGSARVKGRDEGESGWKRRSRGGGNLKGCQ